MTIKLGPMELLATEPLDVIEDYVNGLQPGGGEWTNWSRLSAHDHTGGLMGVPVAAVIAPGSITADQLDPSVLAPYALLDGSRPFTGQVELQADAVVRDTLFFGEQGTALAPDASLMRVGAGVLRQRGTGGAQVKLDLASPNAVRGVQYSDDAGTPFWLWGTEGGNTDLVAYRYAPAGTFVGHPLRLGRTTGTLTLTPDAGQPALSTTALPALDRPAAGDLNIRSASGNISLTTLASGYVLPFADNAVNLGHPGLRWITVYAVAPSINTSSQIVKQGIVPLDPADGMAAVRSTDAVRFTYRAPAPPPAAQQAFRRPAGVRFDWKAERLGLIGAPLAAAGRTQAGFIAEQAAPLFLTGEGQASASNSVGVLLAALKDVDARVTALEGN